MPKERSAPVKFPWMLVENPDPDGDPFFKDTIEHYLARPYTPEFEEPTYFAYYTQYHVQSTKYLDARSIRDGFGHRVHRRRKVNFHNLFKYSYQ
jgi:hypothetical protein